MNNTLRFLNTKIKQDDRKILNFLRNKLIKKLLNYHNLINNILKKIQKSISYESLHIQILF